MFTMRPELLGSFGMVSSTHWLASGVGMAVLERGGNAFDAAVAAGLTLQVAEPHLNGPAGEVPILCYESSTDTVTVVAGQGPAPRQASITHFEQLGLEHVPGTGLLAACVPGAFDAWMLLALEWGRLSLRDLMEPAIGYAERGVPLLPSIAAAIDSVEQVFREHWPESAALWLADRSRKGSWLRNPTLGRTYRRILEEAEAAGASRERQIQRARDVFYRGFVAEEIARFASTTERVDTSGRAHRGLLTVEDLAAFQVPLEKPESVDYDGWRAYKPGGWSQGPVFCQQLRLLEGFDLGALSPTGPDFIHLVVEAAKLAFADREAWYGDPALADVPTAELLSREYAAERRALIGDTASLELRPGSPGGREPVMPPLLTRDEGSDSAFAGSGDPTLAPAGPSRGDTCHLDVVDAEGNIVSATPSGGWLQSSPAIPELGFALGTRAQVFWLDESHPNGLAGGKRPRTTLSCTLAMRDGRHQLAFGTPGGDQQDQWSLVFFLRHLHHGMNLQEAIEAPMFHSEHFPSSFYPRHASPGRLLLEERFPDETVEQLERRGHDVVVVEGWSLGRLSAVGTDRQEASFKAGANPRGMQGYAVGR